ncbi:hypothetical protein [Flaviaesturariibacter amylovorans]|uniref:Uncharacterized protein n=1 Tax=Flaviaesturariibacter amylovorans TaxID=1084520 RepID=A0ABP8GQD7_9BACT
MHQQPLSLTTPALDMPTVSYYQDRDFLYRHTTGTRRGAGKLEHLSRDGDCYMVYPPNTEFYGSFLKRKQYHSAGASEWEEAARKCEAHLRGDPEQGPY